MAWYRSTTNPTGLTDMNNPANALARLNTFFTDCAAEGASFLWTVASYQSTSPRYLVLKRKNGSAGRLMLFGGDSPNSAALGPVVTANTSTLYCGYSRTSTSDTPTTAYTSGAPFADWFLANSVGGLAATSSELRAYCNSDNDTLFWAWTSTSSVLGYFAVGQFLRNEAGTACMSIVRGGVVTTTTIFQRFFQASAGVVASSSAGDIAYALVYDATLGQIVRVASSTVPSFDGTQAAQNERFISASGIAKFLPYVANVLPGGPVPENRLYTTRHIGWGPFKTLGFQWTDAAANPKGYYVGYNATTADVCGVSLLDDTF